MFGSCERIAEEGDHERELGGGWFGGWTGADVSKGGYNSIHSIGYHSKRPTIGLGRVIFFRNKTVCLFIKQRRIKTIVGDWSPYRQSCGERNPPVNGSKLMKQRATGWGMYLMARFSQPRS